MPATRVKGRVWKFAEFEFHEVSRKLLANGAALRVEGKPREVLACLLEQPEQVVSVGYLLDVVWPDVATGPESVMTAVAKLRRIFGGATDRIILTLPKEGYRMALPVTTSFEEEIAATLYLRSGDEIPRRPGWRALEQLSHNEASPVWLARNQRTGEQRVFKFALDGLSLRALQREFAVFRLLTKGLGADADFLVRLVGASFEELPAFLESVPSGTNLLEWSQGEEFRKLALEARVAIAARVATSVALAHQLAVFHNDLKPSNLLISEVSSKDAGAPAGQLTLRVADFGAASLAEPGLLHRMDISDPGCFADLGQGQVRPLGTEMYRAPESRASETPSALHDVYAVGVLLYQLASCNFGEPPLPGWEKKISDPLLRDDIGDAANVDPAKRIQTMADLATRLNDFDSRRKQKLQDEATRASMRAMEVSLERIRMRRPWVRLAIGSLAFGLLTSLWTAYRAVHERNVVQSANATLEQMYEFLAKDVLGQSNPYLRVAGQGDASKQTLVEAVEAAVPQIDGRFSQQPRIAGKLHETIADTYKDRTHFRQADQEYEAAARDYRAVDSDLSQAALIVDLKRDFADLASMRPGGVAEASADFQQQEARIGRVKQPSATLQTYETLVKTTLLGLGPHPEQVLGLLDAAVKRAEATPGFDSALLIRLKKQYCGTYARLGDGANLERVSRTMVGELSRQYGASSTLLFPYQMYLEEAFYFEGKYAETVEQANANFARFSQVLGNQNQLTISTLATRAAAEGQTEKYGDAVRDEQTLHAAAQGIGDRRLEVGSLNDAATFECRQGDFGKGMEHARQVMRDAAPGPSAQPMFYNGSMFTLAECLLGSQERAGARTDAHALTEASDLLTRVDVRAMSETSDPTTFNGARDVALARLELLKGDREEAGRYVALADPLVDIAQSDPFERRALGRVKSMLAVPQH